jgi:hypothetical protein
VSFRCTESFDVAVVVVVDVVIAVDVAVVIGVAVA